MAKQPLQYYIDRYQDGSITTEEWLELQHLLKDPATAQLLDDIIEQQLRDAAGDAEAGEFDAVSNRIVKKTIKRIRNEHRPVKRISKHAWTIAASVIVLIAIGIIARTFSYKKEITVQAPVNDIQPGHDGAILTLSDGRRVLLDTLKNGVIVPQAGVQVRMINGKLVYEGSNNGVVAYNTISTPKARKYQLVLPDGSAVWLNAASSIRYPVTFTGKERAVDINGEAYFEVVKDPQKPFKVNVSDRAVVEVFGTRFNVNAYDNESETKVTLLEGSVQVKNLKNQFTVALLPGKQATINNQSNAISEKKVDAGNVIAWKSSVFIMDDLDIETVMRQLARWYDVEVVYPDGVPSARLTGDIPGSMSLAKVLQVLEISGVKCTLEGRKIIVSK